MSYKSGFITIIGRPNVGKSTLLNCILGQKVAITSDKPQTTRNTIRGVYTRENIQAVFLDTPGVHKPKHKLDKYMMDSVKSSMGAVDIIFYIVDVQSTYGPGEEFIIKSFANRGIPVFLILNKIDTIDKETLFPLIEMYAAKYNFAEVFPISAVSGHNLDRLLEILPKYLPDGPQYYPEDTISDQPEEILVAELIREKILSNTHEEIPHSCAVTVSQMEERPGNMLYIGANIYVDRESQKGIIIGKNGSMLKTIGSSSRREIERLFGCGVFLDLWVKTKRDWRNNEGLLRDWSLKPE